MFRASYIRRVVDKLDVPSFLGGGLPQRIDWRILRHVAGFIVRPVQQVIVPTDGLDIVTMNRYPYASSKRFW